MTPIEILAHLASFRRETALRDAVNRLSPYLRYNSEGQLFMNAEIKGFTEAVEIMAGEHGRTLSEMMDEARKIYSWNWGGSASACSRCHVRRLKEQLVNGTCIFCEPETILTEKENQREVA